ncbi:hypothetical protein DY000_02007344 [Brassica cretica]|nr:hypothetical protein DY000_02007344 [Brassica cretica]
MYRWCATEILWVFQFDLAYVQIKLRYHKAIGTYASYLSSETVLPSNVSFVEHEKVAIAPA